MVSNKGPPDIQPEVLSDLQLGILIPPAGKGFQQLVPLLVFLGLGIPQYDLGLSYSGGCLV